jgi:hypothetical protein
MKSSTAESPLSKLGTSTSRHVSIRLAGSHTVQSIIRHSRSTRCAKEYTVFASTYNHNPIVSPLIATY